MGIWGKSVAARGNSLRVRARPVTEESENSIARLERGRRQSQWIREARGRGGVNIT